MSQYLQQSLNWTNGIVFVASAVLLLAIVLGFVTYSIYFQRKILGWMQRRIGPNRVGPLGLLQTVADVLKLLLKEDTIPKAADKPLFILAPVIAFMPAFGVLAVMPLQKTGTLLISERVFFTTSPYPVSRSSGLLPGAGLPTINTR